MSRTTARLAIVPAAAVLLVAGAPGSATHARADTLDELPAPRYVEFVRDRFATLTHEAAVNERLADKFRPTCDPASPSDSEEARACAVVQAAEKADDEIRQEEQKLVERLTSRYGGRMPAWARAADARFSATLHHGRQAPASGGGAS